MHIKKITGPNLNVYDELARTAGSAFDTLEWLKLFGDRISIYGIFDKGDNLIGGFHLYKRTIAGSKIYLNPPFTPFFGPFYITNVSTEYTRNNFQKKILCTVADFVKKHSALLHLLTLERHIIDTQPFIWRKFKVNVRYSYRLDLSRTKSELWNNLSSDRRKSIKRAEKDEIEIVPGKDLNVVLNLIRKTFTRQKLKKDINHLEFLLRNYCSENNSIIRIAVHNGKPIAAALCIIDARSAYYVIGGYDHENRHHGAGPSTIWNCIIEARKRGVKEFDFDGSMIPLIERYFRGFGANLLPFFRIQKSNSFVRVILNLFGRENF